MLKSNATTSSKFMAFLLALLLIYGFLMTVERISWANNYYPMILVKGELIDFSINKLASMRKSCKEPLELNAASNGLYIRCGEAWPFASTWFVSKNNLDKETLKSFYQQN